MSRALPTKENLIGRRFGKLEVIGRSDKRGSRGARRVPLWECRCDCGNITYKATDTLTNPELSMCNDCVGKYASQKMREKAGYFDGTQISRLTSTKLISTNTSGCRGVYFDKRTGLWRARLKFKGKLMNFGSYKNFADAVQARKDAEKQIKMRKNKQFSPISPHYYLIVKIRLITRSIPFRAWGRGYIPALRSVQPSAPVALPRLLTYRNKL